MMRGTLVVSLVAVLARTVEPACPVVQSSPYRNEPSPFGWPVAPFNFDYANQNAWSSNYATCGGLMQSPIDIGTASTTCPIQNGGADGSLKKAASYSGLQGGSIVNVSAYLRTVYAKGNFGTLTLADQVYTATQVHVTTPSFHTVNGKSFNAEMLIFHVPQGQVSGLNGSAIVSVLFNLGGPSPLFSAMGITNDATPISVDNGGSWAAPSLIDIAGATAGPLSGSSYMYNGSVPVPPCTENVKWFVTTSAQSVSAAQVNKLASYLTCYAGGTAGRNVISNPPPLTALAAPISQGTVATVGVCRPIIKNSQFVGGPHDQATCQAMLSTGSPAINNTAACWDTGMPQNYYSKCLGSPIDIKSMQALVQPSSLPANSFMFFKPVFEVQASPSTYSLQFTPVNRSQIDNYADFGYILLNGRQFRARRISFKAISSHTVNGQSFAGELNIESTLYGDDLHDLYNMSLVSPQSRSLQGLAAGQYATGQTIANAPVNGDSLHRVIVSIPLTIGSASPLLLSMGAGTAAYSAAVASGTGYNIQNIIDINASLQSVLTGSFEWYSGGLTTPGCSNYGVRWIVFETPLQISIDQLNVLALPVSGMDSTRVNQTVINPANYANHVWRNSVPPFGADDIRGAEQMCDLHADWNYANTSCWAAQFPVCSTGMYQSPIDINTSLVSQVGKDYFPGRAGWHPISALRVANTGRSIGVNNEQMGYVMQLGLNGMPKYYQVTQFNLHMPSEHTINGRQYAAELSVAHKNQLSVYQLDPADLMITSFLFNVGTVRNPLLDQLMGQAPILPGQWAQSQAPIDLLRSLGVALDGNFYRYNGSLTTPPCSQVVKWFIFETALNMSQDQWVSFKAMFPNPTNNRPVQAFNNRTLAKNSFMEGQLQQFDYYLNRATGINRPTPGPAWIIAPVVGTVLLAGVVMLSVFVKEDRRRKLEAAGGLVDRVRV